MNKLSEQISEKCEVTGRIKEEEIKINVYEDTDKETYENLKFLFLHEYETLVKIAEESISESATQSLHAMAYYRAEINSVKDIACRLYTDSFGSSIFEITGTALLEDKKCTRLSVESVKAHLAHDNLKVYTIAFDNEKSKEYAYVNVRARTKPNRAEAYKAGRNFSEHNITADWRLAYVHETNPEYLIDFLDINPDNLPIVN